MSVISGYLIIGIAWYLLFDMRGHIALAKSEYQGVPPVAHLLAIGALILLFPVSLFISLCIYFKSVFNGSVKK